MGKRLPTLIVGLGRTGLSCARFLHAQGVEAAVVDTRNCPPGLAALQSELPQIPVFLGPFDPAVFTSAEQLVLSPGVSLKEPAVAEAVRRGVPVLGDIELFARVVPAPVIAVTGSNGKSTVATLLGIMAEQAGRETRVGANLGTPALDLLAGQGAELYVLELSSFQLETTESLHTLASAVLNVSRDHMDRYPDLAAYAAAKARIYRHSELMVLNRDDPQVAAMHEPGRRAVWFGLREPVVVGFGVCSRAGEEWLARDEEPLMPARELAMAGRHNVGNALAALALGSAAGLPMPAMQEALRSFPGLPHRTQCVAEQDGVRWYDDSKATNVGACIAALEGMDRKVVLIAGGDGKGADFQALRPVVRGKVRAVVVLGRDGAALGRALADLAPVREVAHMGEAVRAASRLARRGDAVMLSPACSSLDMYASFEERGRHFTRAVQELLR